MKTQQSRGSLSGWMVRIFVLMVIPVVMAEASTEKLTGVWTCYVDDETHSLKFLSATQLEFDGEVKPYTLKPGVVEVDYETYPYRFEGDTLVVTADGREIRWTRVAKAKPGTSVDAKGLIGYWKNETDWGPRYLSVISDSELEVGGERVGYTLMPSALRTNGSDYPYALEGDALVVTVPEEGRKVTFKRDHSVLLGAWVAEVEGRRIPLNFLSEDELEYDYQYASYELVPGAVRVDGTDYPYRFAGKYFVTRIDGREVMFQRDAGQLVGTWQGMAQGESVSITFLSESQVAFEGKVAAYTLTPGSIHVEDDWVPYRFRNNTLVVAVPKEGEVVLSRVK